jgi:hypothetical protein
VKPAELFLQPDSSKEAIAKAGEKCFVALYGGDFLTDTLNSFRYQLFVTSAANTKINLVRLPPTENATHYHAYRTYHHVQKWLRVKKNPIDWGWKLDNLTPITTTMDPAPRFLLRMISCKCKKGCRKAGLTCSVLCRFCSGKLCQNVQFLQLADSDDEEDLTTSTSNDRQLKNLSDEFVPSSEAHFSKPGSSKQIKLR